MFSEKAKTNADACRFCWMCRHVCPIGMVTGKESNNARAKGLFISMVNRGTEFDSSMAESMYECILCGSCSNNCATGYEPPEFIREARTKAIVEGLAPDYIQDLFNTVSSTGNIYGVKKEDKFKALNTELVDLPDKADVLLYIGEVAAEKTPQITKAIIGLLKKANINFTILKEESSSGAYFGDLVGFIEEVRAYGVQLSRAIDNSGAKKVVVLDPLDTRIMKQKYSEWNISPKAEIVTATSYIAELIKAGKLKPSKSEKVVTLHDTGALSRDLEETEPGRFILESMGCVLKEEFLNRDLAKASGGALLPCYNATLAKLIAIECWEDAIQTKAATLVTEAPGSYAALAGQIPEGMQLLDIFELLLSAC